ncbi:MAG: hypothetical protein B7Z59_07355 [Acidiphilium sp. 37-67-22]|nr:MAG: hypothetical protein B7Z59_07355 [Acidiphilium sp. 37-67-22]HQT74584.1 hypothetical protein [Acidiphilium sp.]
MAGQQDVENAIVSLIATASYPGGTAAASSIAGPEGMVTCRVYRGMPNAPALEADLARGTMHATVFAEPSGVRNVTRYPREWIEVAPVPATLSVSVAAGAATFAGQCAAGQLAGIAVDGAIFPYAVQARDTPASVASNLAALLRTAGWLVTYAGTTLSVPAARGMIARVVAGGVALREIKRQVQPFRISLWCPDPLTRDAAAAVIDPALAAPQFIGLADGAAARLRFVGAETTDKSIDAGLYRRDLIYDAEYPTTEAMTTPAMLFGVGGIAADGAFIAGMTG